MPVIAPKAPPIKMQGIKTKLVPFIRSHVDWDWQGRWIEPFLGSGAVLLNIAPPKALVSDSCCHLINFYKALQDETVTAATARDYLSCEGSRLLSEGEARYYYIRDRFNDSAEPLDFLFLNRACFNGLVRFNRDGKFNTPFCRKPERFRPAYVTKICNQIQWTIDVIRGKDWQFVVADWRDALDNVTAGDFVYADPPYQGRHTDYYNRWDEFEALELAHSLKQLPGRFLYSMWAQNKFRTNTRLFEWFDGYEIATYSHYYHVGSSESLRHAMEEGLVIG